MLTPRDAIEHQIDMQIRDCCRNGENPEIPVKLLSDNEILKEQLLQDYRAAGWSIELTRNNTWYRFSVS